MLYISCLLNLTIFHVRLCWTTSEEAAWNLHLMLIHSSTFLNYMMRHYFFLSSLRYITWLRRGILLQNLGRLSVKLIAEMILRKSSWKRWNNLWHWLILNNINFILKNDPWNRSLFCFESYWNKLLLYFTGDRHRRGLAWIKRHFPILLVLRSLLFRQNASVVYLWRALQHLAILWGDALKLIISSNDHFWWVLLFVRIAGFWWWPHLLSDRLNIMWSRDLHPALFS